MNKTLAKVWASMMIVITTGVVLHDLVYHYADNDAQALTRVTGWLLGLSAGIAITYAEGWGKE